MGKFEILGGTDVGLKVKDIMDYQVILEEVGFEVPGGWIIAAEVSDILRRGNGFDEKSTAAMVRKAGEPAVLRAINERLIECLPIGKPIFIRSSARSERGGTGIFKSAVLILKGDREKDIGALWHAESKVYASELTDEAKEWRDVQGANLGMALLIQVAVCSKVVKKYNLPRFVFMPILAGDAYTEYYGKPLVRSAIGFGQKVMQGSEPEKFHFAPSKFALNLHSGSQNSFWVFDPDSAGLSEYGEGLLKIPSLPARPFQRLFTQMEKLRKYGHFHLEWALADKSGGIAVLQCAPVEKMTAEPLSVSDSPDKVLLAESQDIVNHGRKVCHHIVYAGLKYWSAGCLDYLEKLNHELKNYLLIVPEMALSLLATTSLFTKGKTSAINYSHFSRAGAFLEKQFVLTEAERQRIERAQELGIPSGIVDHTAAPQLGGAHFEELCRRSDILFLGSQFDDQKLLELPGAASYDNGNVKVWEVEVEVINNITQGKGFVYLLGKPKVLAYTIPQCETFADALRDAANALNDEENVLAGALYAVSYSIIPWRENPNGFNPFAIDPQEIESAGGLGELLKSLHVVLEEGENWVDPNVWNNIAEYLKQLLQKLTQ